MKLIWFVQRYWDAISGQKISVVDFQTTLPRMPFRQGLATLCSLRRNSFDNLSDELLLMTIIDEWDSVGQLFFALYEIAARARLGVLCPAIGKSHTLHHIDGGAWYDRRQRALLFVNAVSAYNKSHQKPSSFGELKRAVQKIMAPIDFSEAFPRMFSLGVIVPEDVSNLFDADFCLAGLVMDAVDGKISFVNQMVINKAYPAMWSNFVAEAKEETGKESVFDSSTVSDKSGDSGNA